ncbi:acyclic terpene utilization AtuA family protein [Feifania hominis]|uniref:Acyclic terpene utilization AtuA family protein n=1 Tax=Feifania hominis TaxID=2763660 RepID=A0A926DCB7_9FIRM|nr:acyclic terpene utilization AtuA family protein [Feifania hominis]MBC8535958.1 acyclic terpene utilization AtuA family protein [Feifania hominis]
MKPEYKILSPTAILGYGFPMESFERGMAQKPDLIAVDAGSTDPGPYYLGAGVSFTDRSAVKRDLEVMITAGIEHNIPVVVGTAGGSGGESHLQWCKQIIEEIAAEHSLHFKLAVIHAQFKKEDVKAALAEGRVKPLEPAPELLFSDVDEASCIVGQMGIEPIIKALDGGAQVVLAGRAYDPSNFAAPAVRAGYDKALAIHLGKILECAAIAATPGSGSDCMLGTLGEDYFCVEPLNPARKCTTVSVAAHTLYEKTNPYILPGPGGSLDLRECKFEQASEGKVKVSGTKFVPTERYTIKLEGAKLVGYRTVSIAGMRDPIGISQIDNITAAVRERVEDNFRESNFKYYLNFTIYGRDGVMGALEPDRAVGKEIGIVIEAVADTQALADTICAFARSTMLHFGYEGRIATAGNLAFPYSPSDFHAGEVYGFCLYHIIEVDDPCAMFPVDFEQI